MKNKKKVCFFVTGLDSGGLENYLLRFLQFKAHDFSEIIVFCKGGKGGQLEEAYLKIPNLSIVKKEIDYFNVFHYWQLKSFFKKNKIEIVCDFTGNFAGLILMTGRFSNINNRLSFYRGSTNHFYESKFKLLYNDFVKKLTFKYATHILSNSKAGLDFFYSNQWQNDSRFQVVYNGINPEPFLNENQNLRKEFNIPVDAFVVGHTGRFNVAKNHKTIIKVAIELCQKYQDIYFLLCGNDVKDNLEPILNEKKLNDRIIVLNNRTDIPKVLNTLDCYYFPSITEGQPNALIEAMIKNLPIVASNIDPIKESVPVSFVPELVEAESVEEAMNKILKVYNNKDVQRFGQWAIEKYNHEKLFEEFYKVLNFK